MKRCLLLSFLFSGGCMVGPKYQQPETSMPMRFEESKNEAASEASFCEWWKQFNDPLLESFVAEALHGNYDLRLAVEKIERARAQYRIEKSHLWPEIDLNGTAMRSRISQNFLPVSNAQGTGFFSHLFNIFQVGFDAIWELDFFGKFRHAKRAAYYMWEAMREDAQSVLISMVSEVAVTYVNIRALQNKIELLKKKIEADESELATVTELFHIGLANELQLNSLISALDTDRSSLPSLETSFKQSVFILAYLLGHQPEGLLAQFGSVDPVPSITSEIPVGLPSDLLRRRPDIRGAERRLAAAVEQVGFAVADLFPHSSLTGLNLGSGPGLSAGFEGDQVNNVFKSGSRAFSVGANLNWNLIDFGRVRGKIDKQNAIQREALFFYEQTVISSLKEVESALTAYFEEKKRKSFLAQKVSADRKTFEIMESLYEIGIANEIQLLQAKKNLLASESSLIESEQSLSGDLISLYKALGGEWTTLSNPKSD